jgi:peptide/nickel transport system substrate-binding protein
LKDNTSAQVPRPENRWTGENRNGWSDPSYDRLFDAFSQSLERNERVRLTAEMERMYTENVPSIPHYYAPNVTAHSGNLKGPVARQTPDADTAVLRVHEWEWKF